MDGESNDPIEQALRRQAADKAIDGMDLSDDYVARRIVIRRELWDELTKLAASLQKSLPGIVVSSADVAAVAIEAGLARVKA